MPPTIISAGMAMLTSGSAAQGTSPAGKVEKPALLKAETAWNSACQSPRQNPNSGTKAKARSTVPASSQASTTFRITSTSSSSRPTEVWFRSSRRKLECVSPIGSPKAESTSTAKVISPSPPSWISTSTTAWPKSVSCREMSTTLRPVTVTAETEVKSASGQRSGAVCASGSISANDPATISSA